MSSSQVQNGTLTTDIYRAELTPMDTLGWSGLVYFLIIQVASTLGGIGGGTVMLPACLIFLRFSPKVAVAHAEMFSTISCIARLLFEFYTSKTAKKPSQRKMQVNFDLVVASLGPSVLGSFLGVQLNLVCPDVIILGSASLLLGALTYMAFRKYLEQKSKEQKQKSLLKLLGDSDPAKADQEEPIDEPKNTSIITEDEQNLQQDKDGVSPGNRDSLKPRNPSSLTLWDAMIMVGMMTLNPMLQVLRGSSLIPSVLDIQRCTQPDILIVAGFVLLLCTLTILITSYVSRRAVTQAKPDLEMQDAAQQEFTGDFKLTNSFLKTFPLKILFVTFLGSFLAAGSSTVVNLLLIWSGVNPFVASSTTLMTSTVYLLSATCIFMLNGMIYPMASLVCGSVVLVGTLIARGTLYERIMAQGKGSCILLFITLMMVVAIPANITQVGPHILREYREGANILEFLSPCQISKGH